MRTKNARGVTWIRLRYNKQNDENEKHKLQSVYGGETLIILENKKMNRLINNEIISNYRYAENINFERHKIEL